MRFLNVSVEKAGGQTALEKEIAALVPLIFWERGYYFYPDDRKADYVVDVQAREREYTLGWKTRRSLALEVRLWRDQGEDPRLYGTTPLAAAQVFSTGSKTFASSRQINRMLRTVVGKSLRALHHKNPKEPGKTEGRP
jgi:muconolactone delta-isomerase